MKQSGHGEEPREGIVLPSDGGEPLLPGQTGTSAGAGAQGGYGGPQPGYGAYGSAQGGYGAPQPGYGAPQADASGAAPTGAQAWGTPWGPDQQQASQAQPPEQDWSQPATQTWGTPQQPAGTASQPQPGGYDTNEPTSYYLPPVGQPLPSAPAPQSQPLPAQEGQVATYDAAGASGVPQQPRPPAFDTNEPTSYYLPPVGQSLPSAPAPQSQPLPAQEGQVTAYGAPLGADAAYPPAAPPSAPLPPVDEGATQFIPPVPAAASEGATQYLPPVGPGALPPETPAGFPGQPGAAVPGAGPLPQAVPGHPDSQATQFIPPVPGGPGPVPYGGERQPPSDFDNLFRSASGGDGGAAATQQIPRYAQPEAAPGHGYPQPRSGYGYPQPQSGYGHPQPAYVPPGPGGHDDGRYDDGDGGGRRSRVPVLVAVGVGIVVLGIGAGALLAGGGGDDGDKNQTVSATAPATDGSASPAADAAKAQAVELDKLLADSGNSRSAVINAVADVKSCKNLGQAAQDLRDAARQRTDLVTRLKSVAVDKLPSNAQLTTALTQAWQASASADNHYAAWADQTAGKKGCKKGQARTTGQAQAGNRASGTASQEKAEAAKLWNAIARKYGLTERSATQL